jgi:glycosyltransferase involved in cell wall biosynthesis
MSLAKMLQALRCARDRGPSGLADKIAQTPEPHSDRDESEPPRDGSPLPPVVWDAALLDGPDPRDDMVHSVLAMADSGMAVSVWPSPSLGVPGDERDERTACRLADLCCEPPGGGEYVSIRHAAADSLRRDENACYCIGRTAVETPSVPEEWAQEIESFDEIWVPSAFSLKALAASGVTESKIRLVPSAVSEEIHGRAAARPAVERDDGFAFVTVLDWDYLRGLDVVLEAYVREFHKSERVSLVLVAPQPLRSSPAFENGACGPGFWNELEKWLLRRVRDRVADEDVRAGYETLLSTMEDEKIREALRRESEVESRAAAEIVEAVSEELKGRGSDVPDIVVVNRTLPKALAPRIYSACDAFVMAPRAERWGRPFLESMAVGLPTIGTRWGGHLDFMRPDNSFLIAVRELLDVEDESGTRGGGLRLAEPDVTHLRELMRRVVNHPADARARAAKGAAHVRSRYSLKRVSSVMAERLGAIAGDGALEVAAAA